MNWQILAAVGQLAAIVIGIPSLVYLAIQIREQTRERRCATINTLAAQWSELLKSLNDSADFSAIYLRGLQSFGELDAVSKLRFSAFFGRFFKNSEGMHFHRRDGVLGASLWGEIERIMNDLLGYPGTRQWWETRKHWHTDEFARVVDEIIAKAREPKAYATYNLSDLPRSQPCDARSFMKQAGLESAQ
jgi:hypothetical protein